MIIDFHAHVLPRCDHGCHSSAMALAQLSLMKSAGTDAVVATPHFYPNEDSIASFLAAREGALDAMREKLPLEALPTVYPAAEVLVCEGLHKMKDLESLTVSGTNVILLEMPFRNWSEGLMNTVLGVKDRGLVPVLAHINRYDLEKVEILLDAGILAQVNAEAFAPFKNFKRYVELMEEGKVVALGSDLHEAKRADYKRFLHMQKKLGTLADAVFANTEKLLKNATPLYQGEREKTKQTQSV